MADIFTPEQIDKEAEAAFREQGIDRSLMMDDMVRQSHIQRLESLVDLLQSITEPTRLNKDKFDRFSFLVEKELGLGYIERSQVEVIQLNLSAARLAVMMGMRSLALSDMEEVMQVLLISRSIGGQFIKQLLTTSVEKRLISVGPEQGRKWLV